MESDEDGRVVGAKRDASLSDDIEDLELVKLMLSRANAESLAVEVVKYYGDFRSEGDNVRTAVTRALYEWDI